MAMDGLCLRVPAHIICCQRFHTSRLGDWASETPPASVGARLARGRRVAFEQVERAADVRRIRFAG